MRAPSPAPAPRAKPKPKPRAQAPNFPKAVPRKPGAATGRTGPSNRQLRQAREQQRAYHRQAGAVRRAALVQKSLGPGMAVPHKKVLAQPTIEAVRRKRTTQSHIQERGYTSQARDIAKRGKSKTEREHPELYLNAEQSRKAGFKEAGAVEKASTVPLKTLAKGLANVPKDAKELAITAPTSIAEIAKRDYAAAKKSVKEGSPMPLLKEQGKMGGEIIKSYVDVVKHPLKSLEEHPVSTTLMFSPSVKVPLRAAGKVARVTGKQSLRRATVDLPGTTLKEHRRGRREVIPIGLKELAPRVGRQARNKRQGPHLTRDEIHRRVDEFQDYGQQHKTAAATSAIRDERRKIKDENAERKRTGQPKLDKAERKARIEERTSGAQGGARQHVRREFAREFGSHWTVHHGKPTKKGAKPPPPMIVKPKNVGEHGGVLHADRADAQRVADAVPFEARVIEVEGATPGKTGGYAVVPETAIHRLERHAGVGRGGHGVGPILRHTGDFFRKTVLPLTPKWLYGQATEAGLRALAQGAGPVSYLRGKKVLKRLKALDPDAYARLEKRGLLGGQYSATGSVGQGLVHDVGKTGKTLAEELDPGKLQDIAVTMNRLLEKPGARHARSGYRRLTNTIFGDVNGFIERNAKTAMLGKAVSKGPLLEHKMITLGPKAMQDAAEGLRGTAAQVELARAIDRAYGRYSKFSPKGRDAILHSTPFVPWMGNMANFLFRVLPEDHPVKTSLMTAWMNSQEDERRRAGLSTLDGSVPPWMLGATRNAKGQPIPLARYGPFLPGEYAGALGGQYAPFLQSSLMNLSGVDWTGQQLKDRKGNPLSEDRKLAIALLSLGEATIPGLGLANRTTGLGDRYLKLKDKPSILQGKSAVQGLLGTANPVRPIESKPRSKRKSKPGSGLGGGGLGGGGLGGSGLGGGGL